MPLHTIVLRYYDFDFQTIPEHTKIIDTAGSAWWAWWKKSQENWQGAALEEVAAKCPIIIGLINRTAQEFYAAKCEQVMFDRGGAGISTPDLETTPSYYKYSKHPAWFRLSSIRQITKEQFIQDFGEAPQGEPTLFVVQRKRNGIDLIDEKIFDTDIIRTPGNSILHISDIHFGADHGYSPVPKSSPLPVLTLAQKIDEVVRSAAPLKIGMLVISGDLLTKGNPEGFIVAHNFLESLLAHLGLGKEHLVIVPGNHDISIEDYQTAPYQYAPEDPYRNFLKSFFGTGDGKIERLQHFKTPSGWVMNFLSLNSSSIRKKDYMEYGYVGKDKYVPFLDIIKNRNGERTASQLVKDKILNFVVLHHHLLPVQEVDAPEPERPVSLMLDAGQLVSHFQNANIHYVLHGHQHVPFIGSTARARRRDREWLGCEYPLFVLGSGSCGASVGRLSNVLRNNTLSIYTPRENGFNIRVEEFNPDISPSNYLEIEIPHMS